MFQFADIENSLWILALFVVLGLYFYGNLRTKALLSKLASKEMLLLLCPSLSEAKKWTKLVFLCFAIFFLVLALMRPQGDPVTKTVTKKGRDLVFVIDVSKSMLAEDLKPNRLERAKQLVGDVVEILEGDRIGLLVFAGSTAIKSPLTLDYPYFKNILNRIGPEDVNRGGTLIGDSIRVVSERLFYDQDNKYRDVILMTDGEDHESFPIKAAEDAALKGIRIHTVGLGDPEGSNIPLRKRESYQLLRYKDQVVESRLDEETLKRIAEITRGVFIPVRTNLADLAELYKNYIASAEKKEVESKESKIWSELFQFFLGIAVLFLLLEMVLGERRFKRSEESY
ncbi:MAG: VWA domain-containing protein [Deltaproteobacteria bacterium]|nr:VWA domain-containing protein [Deltaproteobacteria bacterium]